MWYFGDQHKGGGFIQIKQHKDSYCISGWNLIWDPKTVNEVKYIRIIAVYLSLDADLSLLFVLLSTVYHV